MRYAVRLVMTLLVLGLGGAASAHPVVGVVRKKSPQYCPQPAPKCCLFHKAASYRPAKAMAYIGVAHDCSSTQGYAVGCGRCVPDCYLGVPCPCCDHRVHYSLPLTRDRKALKEQVEAGTAIPIERPGLGARLRGDIHFTRLP